MSVRIAAFSSLVALALSFGVAGHSHAAPQALNQSIGVLQSNLEREARLLGVTIKDVRYLLEAGPNASCTVTATVSIPGGTGVTISATAATCAIASQMVQDAIRDWYRSMVP